MKKLIFFLLIGLLAGCNFNTQETTPTAQGVFEEPINPLPQVSPSPTASPLPTSTPPGVVMVITSIPSETPLPSETPVPEPTEGPWEYVIQPDDTLGSIIQRAPFNYRTFDVIREIVRINDTITNADNLPPPGTTILIPQPTLIPMVVEVAQGEATSERRVSSAVIGQIDCHTILERETLVGITEQYGITLEIISQLNPAINFFGCNFEEPSGGPSCNPIIVTGNCINVPFPTPTPTLTLTPSGMETATPTPTFRAPSLISPPEGGTVSGAVTLYWDSVGILAEEEYYLVQVTNLTTGASWPTVTKNTLIRVDASIAPTGGETHDIQWRVSIARTDASGAAFPVGSGEATHNFKWR